MAITVCTFAQTENAKMGNDPLDLSRELEKRTNSFLHLQYRQVKVMDAIREYVTIKTTHYLSR